MTHAEDWALSKIGKSGTFVELGAHDGVLLSNTLRLERDHGWTGLLVEPSSHGDRISKFRDCKVDRRAVSDSNGEYVLFTESKLCSLYSGIKEKLTDRFANQLTENTEYTVETVTLNKLLDQHRMPPVIDFLVLDTEGNELQILSGFDWSYVFRCLVVEHLHQEPKRTETRKLLEAHGYTFDHEYRVDDYFVQ